MARGRAVGLVAGLLVLGYFAYLAYAIVLKYMFMPDDYITATQLLRRTVDDCDALQDSLDLIHKYNGTYVFVLRSHYDGLDAEYNRYSLAGDLKRAEAIEDRVPALLSRHDVTFSCRLSRNTTTLVAKTVPRLHYGGSDSGWQEFYCFAYEVPKDVPKKQQVRFTFSFDGCTQAVLDSMGQVEVHLRIFSTI
jgi:hypothetical protein